jgi:hypothetical protein
VRFNTDKCEQQGDEADQCNAGACKYTQAIGLSSLPVTFCPCFSRADSFSRLLRKTRLGGRASCRFRFLQLFDRFSKHNIGCSILAPVFRSAYGGTTS